MTFYKHALRVYRKHLSSFFYFRLCKALALASWRRIQGIKSLVVRHPLSGRYRWLDLSHAGHLSISRVKVAPGEVIQIPAPSFSGYGAQHAVVRTPALRITSPAVEIFEFGETLAVGGIDFLFFGKKAIHHDLFMPLQHRCPAENVGVISVDLDGDGLDLRLTKAELKVGEVVSLIGQCSGNYAHWLTETLPKLAVLDATERFKDFPLLVDGGLHPNILASVDLINRDRREIIQVPRWAPVRAGRLVAVSSPGYERYVPHTIDSREPAPYVNIFSRAALRELRSAVVTALGDDATNASKKVYLSRSGCSGNMRQIANNNVIEQIVTECGIQRIQPDTMSFREQVQACMNAELIVGPIGASLANMIFAPPGCRIVSLSPYYDDASYLYYANLAGVLGHQINFVLGKQTSTMRHPMHRDYWIDENALKSVL